MCCIWAHWVVEDVAASTQVPAVVPKLFQNLCIPDTCDWGDVQHFYEFGTLALRFWHSQESDRRGFHWHPVSSFGIFGCRNSLLQREEVAVLLFKASVLVVWPWASFTHKIFSLISDIFLKKNGWLLGTLWHFLKCHKGWLILGSPVPCSVWFKLLSLQGYLEANSVLLCLGIVWHLSFEASFLFSGDFCYVLTCNLHECLFPNWDLKCFFVFP